jgi:predicted phage terminase large subunit-like protein
MAANDYKDLIKTCAKEIEQLFKGKGWNDDEVVTQIFQIYYEAIWQQIHGVLAPQKTEKAEKEIRDIIAKYVIGYPDKKTKVNYIGAINPIKAKLAQINRSKKTSEEFVARYLDLYDDFMALAAFRSYKYYCLYMQSCFGFTLWEDTQNCFEGYWFYANRMVLDGEVKFLEKQLPTGFGKSLSDAFMQSWILGVDIDNDILKVCGNDKFTDDCFQNVVEKLMLSPKFSKIFPYYGQFKCQKDLMFSFCSRKDLKFAITGSKKSTNLRIVTKLSDVNGVRAKYLFLDDITQRKDMSNLTQHNKDIHSFNHEWFERNYNRNNFFIVASGTTYSQFDILSYLKRVMGGENTKKSPINKYTHIGKSNFIVPNGISVFVCVPLLDYETDESTYPAKISTESARKKREENPTEFWAMDMQRPLPPDSSPFYFTKLRQYTTLPAIGECNRLETCVAALDTKRRGKDFLSMPIFFEADDSDRKGQTAFFLVDWLYDDRPMKECIPLIVSKVIQHKITRLYVERNTDECIETILSDKLKEQGYTACVIEEVYSTEPKDRRIMSAEGDIKARMIFPQYGMYSQSNDIGKALMNVYGYTYTGTVAHDDAPDSLALFSKRFIMNNYARYATITTFRR